MKNYDLSILQSNLTRRGFAAHVCDTSASALECVLSLLAPSDRVIGIGNSVTLRSMGLVSRLSGYIVHEHTPGCPASVDHDALSADVYFTSANALSYDGQIVNIDGNGNRTAATCFGPRHVIFVIGRNKIADDLLSAIKRAEQAAMRHAKFYNKPYSCAVKGVCDDCLAPDCICGVTVVHRKQLYGNKITVVVLDEDLGN